MSRTGRLTLCCLWASIAAAAFVSSTARAVSDFEFETSGFLRHSAYRNVPRLNPESAADGAYGAVNRAWDLSHGGKWYIEEQRYGADLVSGGIATGNTDAIDRGLLILRWGFAQQRRDGGFDCPDTFHSTSFFVEAVAHALLLLNASDYAARYSQAISDMKPKLLLAARWMTSPENESQGKRGNAPFTHRRYLVAAALGETGVLLQEPALIERSKDYIREGISLQSGSGYNPERGGWDSSYHAVGMLYACRYFTIVADGKLKQALAPMLDRAMRWEASRVNDQGDVSTDGNTRVGGIRTEMGRSGKQKTVAVGQVYRAFYYWSLISGDASYAMLAQRVAQQAHQWHATA